MDKKIERLRILKLKKINCIANKSPIFLNDVDIEKVYKKTSFGEKLQILYWLLA